MIDKISDEFEDQIHGSKVKVAMFVFQLSGMVIYINYWDLAIDSIYKILQNMYSVCRYLQSVTGFTQPSHTSQQYMISRLLHGALQMYTYG